MKKKKINFKVGTNLNNQIQCDICEEIKPCHLVIIGEISFDICISCLERMQQVFRVLVLGSKKD